MRVFTIAWLTAVAYLSKVLVSLFIIKEISVTFGPEGLGFLGNFMTLVSLSSTLAGGGVLSGIVKYVAEYRLNPQRCEQFIGGAFLYSLFFSVLTLCVGVIFIKYITNYIFLSDEYRAYIYFFLVAQLIVSLNNFSFGVANGLGKNSVYTMFLLVGNVVALIIAYYSIRFYGMWGAVIAILAPAVLPFIPVFFYAFKQRVFQYLRFDSFIADARLLSEFTIMRLFSVLCFPLVEILITNHIKFVLGVESAGFWQAVTKLSTAYLSFYSMLLTFYFLPLLSSMYEKKRIALEVNKMAIFSGFSFVTMVVVFFLFKNFIICMVLSDKFLPMADLMGLQMIGDFFRILGWVIGFVAISKSATKLYILGEFFQGSMFLLLTHFMVANFHSLRAVILSYVITCFLYCMISVVLLLWFLYDKPMHSMTESTK